MRYYYEYCDCAACHHRPYGITYFLLDLVLLFMTSGLWIFWIIYRSLRSHRF